MVKPLHVHGDDRAEAIKHKSVEHSMRDASKEQNTLLVLVLIGTLRSPARTALFSEIEASSVRRGLRSSLCVCCFCVYLYGGYFVGGNFVVPAYGKSAIFFFVRTFLDKTQAKESASPPLTRMMAIISF